MDFDTKKRVRDLFFVHPDSFQLLKQNPGVIQIDATYKVNKFNMPLLHVVGETCRKKVFEISYGFMSGEDYFHYGWHMCAMRGFFKSSVFFY